MREVVVIQLFIHFFIIHHAYNSDNTVNTPLVPQYPTPSFSAQRHPQAPKWTMNYLTSHAEGVHVIDTTTLGSEACVEDLYGPGIDPSQVPEISVDPCDGLLSVVNLSPAQAKVVYITLDPPFAVLAAEPQDDPHLYPTGSAVWVPHHDKEEGDEELVSGQVTTFVVVLPPNRMVDIGYVVPVAAATAGEDDVVVAENGLDLDLMASALHSDVVEVGLSDLDALLNPDTPEAVLSAALDADDVYPFPILVDGDRDGGSSDNGDVDGGEKEAGVLCSQGVCGAFTHFLPHTKYAYDLACPVGTPIVAVGNGVVLSITDASACSGIHVSNLFAWNSIMIQLDSTPVRYVEYVHISPGSALVAEGDTVVAGQVLASVGQAGFCPSPHLHIQIHASPSPDAPPLPFAFSHPSSPTPIVPTAGFIFPSVAS